MKERIAEKIAEISAVEHLLPCVVIIHNIQKGFSVEHMSKRGLAILGVTNEKLREMGTEYYPRYFNMEEAQDYIPKLKALIENNNMDDYFTYFQQVRASPEHPWEWYLSSTKLLMLDNEGLPLLTITHSVPISAHNNVTQKVERLLEEKTFMRKQYQKYALLTAREKQVLRLLALAKSNKEIADELFISVHTVQTHRKNIKEKLETSSNAELSMFIRAFDMD